MLDADIWFSASVRCWRAVEPERATAPREAAASVTMRALMLQCPDFQYQCWSLLTCAVPPVADAWRLALMARGPLLGTDTGTTSRPGRSDTTCRLTIVSRSVTSKPPRAIIKFEPAMCSNSTSSSDWAKRLSS